ncbi:hypothetical protein NEPAR06_0160 [Nematocida parisii]|uniref:Uncharacterized protein n=1 Tax=Nematocida parisii (strain ERTm3) TaxID=935791 RepID=I3EDI0_NEMP3|nr:uncharacterized protein NEPG_00551 [Nematocida parisii ERTm1]EIJ87277.1 hypothetical protein NEQG_02612 [Nematocida parisii ERTm3]KAI5143125.1 hypothetical protein NEPAR07_0487 [Nematocida parisii]EIJ95026.1 hypothetical protein NEPG_00551 [Nematocida parisii ERTm1]KAI5144468.1 hypothetical protein NEPAR04_2110 [Nematocida parisii]KAI5153082.1 hypothetical protein NEPAR06_0160 [Nematocida parisii]|eukprot:XP_013058382.1 hypothetical protein NEPG_00551 [Nematocida parisii ERTm1]
MSCETSCSSCPSKGMCAIKNEGNIPSEIQKKFMNKTVVGVMSGKGGVGKSTISASLALQISKEKRACLIDADIAGPSISRVTGVDSSHIIAEKLIPSQLDSLDIFTPERGKEKYTKGIEILQYLESIDVEEYDVVVIDTPPGTSDIHIALAKHIPEINIILVSTPHRLSIADTNRQISFCNKSSLKIIGVVENMSGHTCGHCNFFIPVHKTLQLEGIGEDVPRITVPMNQTIAKESDCGVVKSVTAYMNIKELKIFN